MSHALTDTRRAFAYILVALAVVIAIILTVNLRSPSTTLPANPLIPVTGQQNVYSEYLQGEKLIYAVPMNANDAMTAYRLGEKTSLIISINSSDALTVYRLGEKNAFSLHEYALLIYRMGEKDY